MSLSAEDRDDLARAAEVIVGLGVVPIMGCRLCARGSACPVHVGQRVAAEQQRVVEAIVARHVAAALSAVAAGLLTTEQSMPNVSPDLLTRHQAARIVRAASP